jgi:hypothetical protein
MRGGDRDDSGTTGNASFDSRWRILDDKTALDIETKAVGGQDERIREGLSALEPLVVGSDRNLWRLDSDSAQTAMAVGLSSVDATSRD